MAQTSSSADDPTLLHFYRLGGFSDPNWRSSDLDSPRTRSHGKESCSFFSVAIPSAHSGHC